jgi:sugar phosphate isomerase/epimerase
MGTSDALEPAVKLSVSNIAWDAADEAAVLARLHALGVAGVEVAPTKLWPDWRGASPESARAFARSLRERGFVVPALQSILFGYPQLQVFGDAASRAALLDHLERVAALAQAFGARVLVFGSPKNRDPGELAPELAFERAAELFHAAGQRCERWGTSLCLEPNPPQYACRFMTSFRDVARMVEHVGHPAVRIHLDVACMELAGDDAALAIAACAGRIAHFHVTEPDLGDFVAPRMPHAAIGRALRATGYEGFVSIEMRRGADPVASIERAVLHTRASYGP